VYEGDFANGTRSGKGRLVYLNGKYYDGQWQNDAANGYGTYQNPEQGYKYEGIWKDDKLSGHGTETWETTYCRFEGEFQDNFKEGEGHFTWQDGSYFKGTFIQNTFHGYGEYYFAEHEMTYYGNFENG